MFGWNKRVDLENEELERERLNQMTEKELLIEMIIELKRIEKGFLVSVKMLLFI